MHIGIHTKRLYKPAHEQTGAVETREQHECDCAQADSYRPQYEAVLLATQLDDIRLSGDIR